MYWCERTDQFFALLDSGWKTEDRVAEMLRRAGSDVLVPPRSKRPSLEDAKNHSGSVDLYVDGLPVEVKGRAVAFTCVDDFPWAEPYVCTVRQWRAREASGARLPSFFICASTVSAGIMWLDSRTYPRGWREKRSYDSVRQIEDVWFVAPLCLWQPFDALLSFLSRRHERIVQQSEKKT